METGGLDPEAKRSLLFCAAGFGVLVLTAVVINLVRGDTDQSDPLGIKILFSVLGVVAVALMFAGAVIAWRDLAGRHLESPTGRWAFRLMMVAVVLLPVIVFLLGLLTAVGVFDGDSVPFLSIWLIIAVVASVLGGFAPEPGRRGLLVIPTLIGTAALMLLISEVLGIS